MNLYRKRFGLLAAGLCAVIFLGLLYGSLRPARQSQPPAVQVWLTKSDLSVALQKQPPLTFSRAHPDDTDTVHIDEQKTYQTMIGFGASLTDSSGWLIWNKLNATGQTAVMNHLFSPVSGIGISWLRQPMGASDFSASGNYSYDDMPSGQSDDAALSHFTIRHDQTYIIPLLKRALTINPQLKIMATPWSPPSWMKLFQSMNGGPLKSQDDGKLATYFTKFIQAYQKEGIAIYAVTVQNEPLNQNSGYPTMLLSAEDETNFIKNDLAPAFKKQHIAAKILAYDHNWDQPSYVQTLYKDPSAYKDVAGSAWHCYAGDPQVMSAIHRQYPSKGIYFTECSSGTWQHHLFDADMKNIIRVTRNWAKTYTDWNLVLDTKRGPTNGGCKTCAGLVTVNQETGAVKYTASYYAIGQFSKFIRPGARRIGASGPGGGLEEAAFRNPDGSLVLVVYNSKEQESPVHVKWGRSLFRYTMPAKAAATFVWKSSS